MDRAGILSTVRLLVLGTGLGVMLAGCEALKSKPEAGKDEAGKDEGGKDAAKPEDAVDVGFLLSMSYADAKKISPKHMELPPFYKIAADEITVVSKNSDGTPRRVRAKGHVFLHIDFREELTALGQEALVGGNEVILRGKPLLRRGRSVVEGLEDRTVFFVEGLRLQAVGLHRLTNESGVTPSWRSSWKEGPNPLLPALSPEDVPKDLRASPLLPPVSKDDLPKKPE